MVWPLEQWPLSFDIHTTAAMLSPFTRAQFFQLRMRILAHSRHSHSRHSSAPGTFAHAQSFSKNACALRVRKSRKTSKSPLSRLVVREVSADLVVAPSTASA